MSQTTTDTVVQMYRVYIKATPEAIWEAITSPEWTDRYGYPGRNEYDLRPGGAFRARHAGRDARWASPRSGSTVRSSSATRHVSSCRPGGFFSNRPRRPRDSTGHLGDPPEHGDFTRLTVTHDVTDAPLAAAMLEGSEPLEQGGGGWNWILSTLKTELELNR